MTVQLKVKGYINGNEWGAQQQAALPNVHFTFSGEEASDGVGFDIISQGEQDGDLLEFVDQSIVAWLPCGADNYVGGLHITYSDTGTNFDGTVITDGAIEYAIQEDDPYIAIFFDEDDDENVGLGAAIGEGVYSQQDPGMLVNNNVLLDLTNFGGDAGTTNFYTYIDDWHTDTGHTHLSVYLFTPNENI